MAIRKINVCDKCLGEEFQTQADGTVICKNCKEKYMYSAKTKKWEVIRNEPDQKGFINETVG